MFRRWAGSIAAGFVLVVPSGLYPPFQDAQGRLFGLFKLDLYDDSLHLASGLWAGIAAWWSRRRGARPISGCSARSISSTGCSGCSPAAAISTSASSSTAPLDLPLDDPLLRQPAAPRDRRRGDLGRLSAGRGRRRGVKKRWKILLGLARRAARRRRWRRSSMSRRSCRGAVAGLAAGAPYALAARRAERPPRRGADLADLSRMAHRLFGREPTAAISRPASAPSGLSPIGATSAASGRARARSTASPPARAAAGDAKVMLYTIGLSFSAEMAGQGGCRRTPSAACSNGSAASDSADDRLRRAGPAATTARFMHETPWYDFPFGAGAVAACGAPSEPAQTGRHWERRLRAQPRIWRQGGLCQADRLGQRARRSGRDELTPALRRPRGDPRRSRAIDPRLKPVARRADGG